MPLALCSVYAKWDASRDVILPLVGFDDITEAGLVQPALTTVSVAAKEIGRKAGELLFSRIQGNREPAKRIILPPALVVRESCGFR